MPERKSHKRFITEAVLAQLYNGDYKFDDVVFKWWMTGRGDGLRLTDLGDTTFRLAGIEFYDCPAGKIQPGSWYSFLIELNKKIKCPYYLNVNKFENKKAEPYIRLYDSKVAMMMTLYGDIESYLESIKVRK